VIVDASALLAILLGESDAVRMGEALQAEPVRRISVINLMEVAMRIEAMPAQKLRLERLLAKVKLQIEPVTVEQFELAREAFRRFGKGRHPAGLNLGDCFAYTLAKSFGEPLLFKGEDFAKTDVAVA
jgi:ribonuclease VapC